MSIAVDDSIAQEEKPARPGWFVSPRVDIVLVLGLGALLSVVLSLTTAHKGAFLVAAVAFSLLSDYPHVLATSARVWLDPRERQRYWRHYLISWVVVAAVLSTLMFSGATVVVVAVWAYWQVFHVLKQHFGIINIYAAKNGYRGPRKLLKYSLFAACLAPFAYRASQGLRFSDYEVLGHRLPFSELTVPTPPIPMPVVYAGFGVAAVLVALLAAEQLRLHRSGRSALPAMAWATFGLAVVSYNLSYLLVSDLFALILIATTTHSLQYHLINWTRNNTRFRLSTDPAERRLLLARLSSRKALPLYVLAFAVLGVIAGQLDIVLLGVIPLTFVFHHFYMDGALWKSQGNPELAYDLGIAKR
ncbi:hypothetical protein NDR87_00410 [Nocardia sp. CDC159]|uniref:Transmembrane protein n=1 Tax=Nocardia pulmonis TaxID=2951408 RepID=A0A9X2E1K3_9NOCA|nr:MULTISPECIES: hypothetical protein [Nocardia]MCM6772527.1 hypothetical protein [Nocardia pulmonis]MCM6784815.1 hypothetical protein [Nocardia sp. CDC159]